MVHVSTIHSMYIFLVWYDVNYDVTSLMACALFISFSRSRNKNVTCITPELQQWSFWFVFIVLVMTIFLGQL